MKLYDLYAKSSPSGTIYDLIAVKSNFSFSAFIFNAFYFLYKKMWIEFLIASLINISLLMIAYYQILFISSPSFFILSTSLIIGANAGVWYGGYLKRTGYEFVSSIVAANKSSAQFQFLEGYVEDNPKKRYSFKAFMGKV